MSYLLRARVPLLAKSNRHFAALRTPMLANRPYSTSSRKCFFFFVVVISVISEYVESKMYLSLQKFLKHSFYYDSKFRHVQTTVTIEKQSDYSTIDQTTSTLCNIETKRDNETRRQRRARRELHLAHAATTTLASRSAGSEGQLESQSLEIFTGRHS
jgi:hypothetical protein